MILSVLFNIAIATADCPVQSPKLLDVNPIVLKHYLNLNKSKLLKPEDLICCVAKYQNVEIAVAHSSIAAQNSDYDNPRVVVITKDKNGKTTGMMSINSGAAHLNQNDSVEFMYNNSGVGQIELYDLSFESAKPIMSGKNPETCMGCHGSIDGATAGGPRSIFEPFPWPRFVNPNNSLPGTSSCPNRTILINKMQEKAASALRNTPRFNCIKDKKMANLQSLDDQILEWNERKIAKNLKTTPDFDKYKFALIGAGICDFKPDQWLPKSALSKMVNNQTLSKEIRQNQTPQQLFDYFNNEAVRKSNSSLAQDTKLRADISNIENGKSAKYPNFDFSDSACNKNPKLDEDGLGFMGNKSTLQNQYFVDSAIKGDASFMDYRFLLESRGIDISDWSPSALSGYDRAPKNLWVPLVLQEPKESVIGKLLRDAARSAQTSMFVMKTLQPKDSPEKTCETLKKLSNAAFTDVNLDEENNSNKIVQ